MEWGQQEEHWPETTAWSVRMSSEQNAESHHSSRNQGRGKTKGLEKQGYANFPTNHFMGFAIRSNSFTAYVKGLEDK